MTIDAIIALESHAREVRKHTIDAIAHLGVGHIGRVLTIVELLTLLYYREMEVRPAEPQWKNRDRLVLLQKTPRPRALLRPCLKRLFPHGMATHLKRGRHKASEPL